MMINELLIFILTIYGAHSISYEKVAQPGKFKYMVSIWYLDVYQCSGAIIDKRHILTTASCVSGRPNSGLSVTAGTIWTELPLRQILVESIHFHYGLTPSSIEVHSNGIRLKNDIAIIKIIGEIMWDTLTGPIKIMNPQGDRSSFTECVVPGWGPGRKLHSEHDSLRLKWVKAIILSELQCHLVVPHLLKNENCADIIAANTARLTRNTGSPIVCDDVVIGIIVKEITKNRYIFLDIIPYLNFIADIVDDTKFDAKPGEFPFVVSIWNDDAFLCGGSIVDEIQILTVGHCVRHVNIFNVRVVVGYTQVLARSALVEWLKVDTIHVNPLPAGFAILELTRSLAFNWMIAPAKYPTAIDVLDMRYGKVLRWHSAYTVEEKTLMKLVWSFEFMLDTRNCRALDTNSEEDQFCATRGNRYHNSSLESYGSFITSGNFVVGVSIPSNSESVLSTCYTPFRKLVQNIEDATT